MIKSFLIKLRQKPKHVRQQVALGVASVFTAVVAIFWLTSLPDTVKVLSNAAPEGANAFSSFTDKINEQIEAAKENAPKVSTSTASTSQPLTDLAMEPLIATTTASSTVSTTTPIYVREVRIATTTASTSQGRI